MTPVVVSLGSNQGDLAQNIWRATEALKRLLTDVRSSSLYVTGPMYLEAQPDFVNAVATGYAGLGPIALVRAMKRIEAEIGRTAGTRNGPRLIDLDLVTYGRLQLWSEAGVNVPHPGAPTRKFVLLPWLELEPQATVPGYGEVCDLLASPDVESQRAEVYARATVQV